MTWLNRPTRQSYIAIILIVFNVIKSIVRNWWPILLLVIFRSDRIPPEIGLLLTIGIGLLIIIFSIWSYFRFFFLVSENKLHIEKGVFRRTKLDIPFDRIQSISFEQNIVHQIFEVVRLKIDTAGSAKEEFEFTALNKKLAEQLRTFILENKTSEKKVITQDELTKELILKLGITDLIKIGISQNHFRTAGIILAFILGLRDRFGRAIGEQNLEKLDSYAEEAFQNAFTVLPILFLLLLIISFLGTLIFTILRHYDLEFWKKSNGYNLNAGLLNRREQAVLKSKIQIIRWGSNPVRKLFGIVTLRIFQASSSGRSRYGNISVPGVRLDQLTLLKDQYFSRFNLANLKFESVERDLFYRRWLFIGFIPSALMVGLSLVFGEKLLWIWIGLFWLIVTGIFQHFYQQKWNFYWNQYVISTTQGVLEVSTKIMYLFKVQSVELKQTIYQRRKKLCSLVLHTASGSIRIPYLKLDTAQKMANFILAKVERSSRSWM